MKKLRKKEEGEPRQGRNEGSESRSSSRKHRWESGRFRKYSGSSWRKHRW